MKNRGKTPLILAVSGVKNSGKTHLITRLIPVLENYGLKTATMKHTGHHFDVPGTDTDQHMKAGAYGTAVFSDDAFMVVKKQKEIRPKQLMEYFPEADLILLEGFKSSDYPKFEVIRKENSRERVCAKQNLLGIVTDLRKDEISGDVEGIPLFDLNDEERLAAFIMGLMEIFG